MLSTGSSAIPVILIVCPLPAGETVDLVTESHAMNASMERLINVNPDILFRVFIIVTSIVLLIGSIVIHL